MNIEICNDNYTYIWNQHIPKGAWYGKDEKSWWFCTVHKKSDDNTLELRRFNGTRWIKVQENSKTTQDICAWATHRKLWWTKVQWLQEEDRKKRCVAQRDNHINKYKVMMKHDRKHKKSGSGIRLDKENFYANKSFTDYECSSRPMHDFIKYYN